MYNIVDIWSFVDPPSGKGSSLGGELATTKLESCLFGDKFILSDSTTSPKLIKLRVTS